MSNNIAYVLGHTLYLNITNRCPCACDFCIRTHSKSVGSGENLWLDEEPHRTDVMNALAEYDLGQYRELVFCGYGEPTCRLDDLLWICRKVRGLRDIPIRVNTNGLSDLINGRNTAPEFYGLVDAVSVSLNASTPEKYDAICHSQFGLDALPAVLKFTKEVGEYVPEVVMTVVDNDTPQVELDACAALCKETGAQFRVRRYITTYEEEAQKPDPQIS